MRVFCVCGGVLASAMKLKQLHSRDGMRFSYQSKKEKKHPGKREMNETSKKQGKHKIRRDFRRSQGRKTHKKITEIELKKIVTELGKKNVGKVPLTDKRNKKKKFSKGWKVKR